MKTDVVVDVINSVAKETIMITGDLHPEDTMIGEEVIEVGGKIAREIIMEIAATIVETGETIFRIEEGAHPTSETKTMGMITNGTEEETQML